MTDRELKKDLARVRRNYNRYMQQGKTQSAQACANAMLRLHNQLVERQKEVVETEGWGV